MTARSRWLLLAVLSLGLATVCSPWLMAQVPAPGQPNSPYRKLVPGVLTTINRDQQVNETVSNQDLVELKTNSGNALTWKTQTIPEADTLRHDIKDAPVHRSVWCLEFSFKPMRMITIDYPSESGKFQQRNVWYLIYRVRNTGKHLQPVWNAEKEAYEVKQQDQITNTVDTVEKPIPLRFVPVFSLEPTKKQNIAYQDRLLPLAIPEITKREDPNRKFLNSAEMALTTIPLSTKDKDASVWGVATWYDIDLAVDQFSVYIGGLSNAYRFIDPPGAYKPNSAPGTGRIHQAKYLKLNFWRPSDEFNLNETPIYFGLPQKDAEGKDTVIDYSWVFR